MRRALVPLIVTFLVQTLCSAAVLLLLVRLWLTLLRRLPRD